MRMTIRRRYTAEFKAEAVRLVLQEGLSTPEAARRLEMSAASTRQLANECLVSEIRVLHAESFGSYGSPRIHAPLKRQGHSIGRERVRRLMRENKIVGRHRRKRCRTTDSNHALPLAANLLQQNFICETLNRVWLANITYLATDKDFCTSPR